MTEAVWYDVPNLYAPPPTPLPTPYPSPISSLASHSSILSWPLVKRRIAEERFVFIALLPKIALALVVLLYFCFYVAQELAYYRHVPGTLVDLGFDVVPELGHSAWIIAEIMHFGVLVAAAFVVLLVFVWAPKNSDGEQTAERVSVTSILYRYLVVLTTGHLLRVATFLSTSLPSPAPHCQASSAQYNPPDDMLEVFLKPTRSRMDQSCGALTFSGRLLQMILAVLVVHRYGREPLGTALWAALLIFLVLLVLAHAVLTIGTRYHYSIDCTVASYITPLLWRVSFRIISDAFLDVKNNLEEGEGDSRNHGAGAGENGSPRISPLPGPLLLSDFSLDRSTHPDEAAVIESPYGASQWSAG
eukprot:NODE_1059_length_1734_cov_26.159050_g936_i0.p1 GENE.NODE_1059_length_1734_cov_26.159050_g936_i0~~NODE_1059_length_1734_cov_26.159050_g936_i0.p1  ORF type:complete len:359 (+),score=37.32 NODE_1059_length_1734_cov_26.159050_g936_i0:223-1299(+)